MDRDVLLARLGELLRSTLEEHQVATLPLGGETPLVGPGAVVTSLAFVQFVADVEAVLSEEFGREVILVSEEALSRRHSPFRTLGTLVDYVRLSSTYHQGITGWFPVPSAVSGV